jgi:hypothetical protein
MNRRTLAIVHTCAWAAANLAEFDRRHLHGALHWLFAERPPRETTPLPRALWLSVAIAWAMVAASVAVAWTPWGRSHWQATVAAANDAFNGALVVGGLALLGVFAAAFGRQLRRIGPRVPVRTVLRVEFSDGTSTERPISPMSRITIKSGVDYELDQREPPHVEGDL